MTFQQIEQIVSQWKKTKGKGILFSEYIGKEILEQQQVRGKPIPQQEEMNLMKAGTFFTGKYLTIKDLKEKEQKVILTRTTEEIIEDQVRGKETKLILHFEEFEKGMVLNPTNYQTILEYFNQDDETEHWIGKKAILYNDESVIYGGKKTGGLRIKFPDNTLDDCLSSDQIMKTLELVGDSGWKSSEFKESLKANFQIDKIQEFPVSKLADLQEMIKNRKIPF